MNDTTGAGLKLWRGSVLPEWLDYNGHMTEHCYLQVFSMSSDALYERLGVDFTRAVEGAFFTLETHVRHLHEARAGTSLWSLTEILGYDEKRLHLLHRLFGDANMLLATGEHLAIHVAHGRSCPAPERVMTKIAAAFAPLEAVPLPAGVGSVLGKPVRFARPLRPAD